jgi:hypothetical protein
VSADRRAELSANLAEFSAEVRAVCSEIGRDPGGVTVVVITKTFPASDVRLLAGLGVTDVGENRDQEAAPKHEECADLGLRWHFVGQLQRNKCRSVARYADVVHSIDRVELVGALSTAAQRAQRWLTALVQVSLDPPSADGHDRGGARPGEVAALADAIAGGAGLELGGVMAVAPLGGSADEAFERLAAVAGELRAAHPAATIVSAGMSGDFAAALRHGATHLRVGTALLGRRSTPVG